MRLLYMMRKGAISIDSTMLASTGLTHCGATRLFSAPSASSTKPNSPACARYSPVRSATPGVAPKARVSAATSTNLATTGSVVSTSTSEPLVEHRPPVELHADGDEEQAQQHVVEGPDVGLHLVLVFGLGHQHAGDEGAQRQRQAGVLGQPGQAQRDQQQVQHEQLVALAPRHQRQPPAHHVLAAHQQQRQQHGGLQRGQAEGAGHVAGRCVQRRDQHQQRHHGQILEQQHAHHAAAVLAFQLQPLGHHLHDDGGAGHGHRAAQHHRALPAHLPGHRGEGEDPHQQRSARAACRPSSAPPATGPARRPASACCAAWAG